VLVVRSVDTPPEPRRRLRRRRPRDADAATGQRRAPITTATVIGASAFESTAAADAWLDRVSSDGELAIDEIAVATAVINVAVDAQRAAALDPFAADVSSEHALAVRIGYGDGEQVADGRWRRAIEIPSGERRRRRAQVLRPQETIAAVLAGRERIQPSVGLVLHARADLDADRSARAALQLRVGLEALLAEGAGAASLTGEAATKQAADLSELERRRRATGDAANEALRGPLSDERRAEVAETLEVCERLLRRRRA